MYIAIYVSAIVLLCACTITFFVVKDQRNKKIGKKLQQKAKEENPAILDNTAQNKKAQDNLDKNVLQESTPFDFEKEQNDILQSSQKDLEDFSLELEKPSSKKSAKDFDLNPFKLDDGFTGGEQKAEKDFENDKKISVFDDDTEENSDEDDDDLDKKFKEYEEFLRRNLDLDDEDLDDEDLDDGNLDDRDLSDDDFENEDGVFSDQNTQSRKRQKGAGGNFSHIPNFDASKSAQASDDDMRALQNFDYDSLKGKSEEEIAEIIKNLPPKAQEILMSDILARRKFEDEE